VSYRLIVTSPATSRHETPALAAQPERNHLSALNTPPTLHRVNGIMTGAQLRRLRRSHGMTQPQLAKVLKIHWNTVARWERDGRISPAMVRLIRLLMTPKKEPTR
jgi:DNA-binding transcriptional regulator YiaG